MSEVRKQNIFGWWTTGRDDAAIELFETVRKAIINGIIPGRISYAFMSREPGESVVSDRLKQLMEKASVPVVAFSALKFKPELRKQNRDAWRKEYHHEVLKRISPYKADVVVLAGYMWVVSPETCQRLNIINLHPAAPDGPAGTWQEVIWQLLEQRADYTGVMMHLVTPELDKGPPVTYCLFSIKGPAWDELWNEFFELEKKMGMEGIKKKYGESLPIFAKIREEGVKRELPLIVYTLRSLAKGDISLENGKVLDAQGNILTKPYDLTQSIEESLEMKLNE